MLNLKDLNKDIIFPKLKLVEHLPQVGSKVYTFTFKDGIFISDKKDIVDYIINDNYELLIGKGHYKLNKKKDTLISAGRLKFDNKIVYIDNDSGHYNPSKEHLLEIISVFGQLNLLCDKFQFLDIDTELHNH